MVLEGLKFSLVARALLIPSHMGLIRQRDKGAGGEYLSTRRFLQFFNKNNAVLGIFELKLQL